MLNKLSIERQFWIIRLRWIAVAGIISVVTITRSVLFIDVPYKPLFFIASFLAFYNLTFYLLLRKESKASISGDKFRHSIIVANIQICLDLICLAVLIHYSGGIENPFIFYFIFHIVIASILLSRNVAYFYATFASFLLGIVIVLEYYGILPHYPLAKFAYGLYNNPLYLLGTFFVFASTLYISVYMTSRIVEELRLRERLLEEANRELVKRDRIKNEYVLRVSHDIKEDLAAVQACIEPVENGITGPLNAQQKDLLGRAVERTHRLLFFVKALLEISRIRLAEDLHKECIPVEAIIQKALAYIETRARLKDIEVKVDIGEGIGTVYGFAGYLTEAVQNLLANSVKYTPAGGSISISVRKKGSKDILLSISDTGIGIPSDELGNIFDEFYRARNAREVERTGTGLGLSIVKQIIDKHNGNIRVESVEGKGSTFYITLPAGDGR